MLCTNCGLCCMGALHSAAVLDAEEVPAAKDIGLPVLDREEPGFALPCPKLVNCTCTIYEHRPRVCGRYRCKLLQELENGDIDLTSALTKVDIAKMLLRDARSTMPAAMSLLEARTAARAPLADGAKDQSGFAEAILLRLRTTALDVYLDRHFKNERDSQSFELSSIEPGPGDDKR